VRSDVVEHLHHGSPEQRGQLIPGRLQILKPNARQTRAESSLAGNRSGPA
jgi:hypothetical protein